MKQCIENDCEYCTANMQSVVLGNEKYKDDALLQEKLYSGFPNQGTDAE